MVMFYFFYFFISKKNVILFEIPTAGDMRQVYKTINNLQD